MRTMLVTALLLMAATGSATAASDDRPRQGDISMDEARQIAQSAGYSNIVEIEFDDGRWEIEAQDASGREVDIEIEAVTGKIVRVDRD